MASGNRAVYILPFTVTNPTTVPFLQLATPTNTGLLIHEFVIGQEASTTSAQAVLTAQRRSTASTLPTAGTAVSLDPTGPATRLASSTTTNAYGIASATGTAGAALHRWTFNVLSGLLYVPTPDARIAMDISQFLTFQFPTAPANNIYSGHIVYEEI